jgi:hypothetical protein
MSDAPQEPNTASCAVQCRRCSLADQCKAPSRGPSGWRLTVSSSAAFLLPLILAAGGACLGGASGARQLVGALAGLAIGVAAGMLVVRLVAGRPAGKESP